MEKIDHYHFYRTSDKELGKGSFSIVYRGVYTGPDNKYLKNNTAIAIKVIKTANLTVKAKEILEDEIKIMILIKNNPHPNIVGCYDVVRRDREIFIILELCDSGDLRTILKKPIKEKYAQFYFCQLANGLKYLDQNNIIHRDMKPKNILLSNSRRVLKIADFGFAKQLTTQSLHETICGSPLYMAPEIINNNLYNNQTDLWSIGMILYEMLYGLHPFDNCKSISDIKITISKSVIEIPPQNTKNKDVTESCLSLLRQLLQKQVVIRISWEDFFKHSWVNAYQYSNTDYEVKLFSTSLGSMSTPSLSSTPRSMAGSTPIIRMSCLEKVVIIEDFCDRVGNKIEDQGESGKTINNKDDCIFQMDN